MRGTSVLPGLSDRDIPESVIKTIRKDKPRPGSPAEHTRRSARPPREEIRWTKSRSTYSCGTGK